MSDRELLEGAARAAGYDLRAWLEDSGHWLISMPGGNPGTCLVQRWSPLQSDADAFRLMVDCGIEIVRRQSEVTAIGFAGQLIAESEHLPDTDKHAATRRAITRAAAAMSEGRE